MLIYNKPATVIHRGILKITDAQSGSLYGYIAANTMALGAYYAMTSDQNAALIVSFALPVGATSGSQLRITDENSVTGFPYLGLIEGRDSTSAALALGSFK